MHQLLVPPRYINDAERGFARFQESGSGPVVGKVTEISALRKDGSEFSVELSISALRLHGHWNAIGVIRDITERKQAEARIHLFHELLDHSNDGICIAEPATSRFLDVNETACRDLRYSRDELLQRGVLDIQTAFFDIIDWQAHVQELRAQGRLLLEFDALRKDGSLFPVEASLRYATITNQDYIIAVVRDITERKRAEAVLRESEQRFNHLFENMSSGVGVYQPDAACEEFAIKSVNRALERIERIKREEIIGRSVEEVFPGVRAFGLLEVFKRVCRSGEPEHFPPAFYQDERIAGWRENYVYRLDSGEIVAVYDDVSERKQAEQSRLESSIRLKDALEDAIGAIAATLEQRDPYTAGHQRRVGELAAAIAEEMGLAREEIEGIHFGGLIHDIGKISVPAEILGKPGRLTDIELDLIKTHAEAGYEIVKEVAFPWPVADMVRQHHERLDGSGYPQGLKGEQIVLEARILAVADVVEAMSADRPYRPGFGIEASLGEIIRNRGTHLDAMAVDACLRVFREKGFVFTR